MNCWPLEAGTMNLVQRDGIDYEDYSTSQWLFKVMTDPWKNYLLPAPWLRSLSRLSKSSLIAETFRSPGSWKSMEIIYENANPVDLLDKIAVKDNPISMAARNRRRYVVHKLAECMRTFASEAVINVLGVGAGPGLQVQDAFRNTGLPPSKLNAVFVDLDDSAFAHGTNKAREAGLESAVTYVCGDARTIQSLLPDCQFHLAKLVGIIEYLNDEAVVELTASIRAVMHPWGTLLTHGIQDPHQAMPFLERVFQLKHVQRTSDHVESLLRAAGYKALSTAHLPLGVYSMVSASPEAASSQIESLRPVA
jgi:SAM-dependent methyltransferase